MLRKRLQRLKARTNDGGDAAPQIKGPNGKPSPRKAPERDRPHAQAAGSGRAKRLLRAVGTVDLTDMTPGQVSRSSSAAAWRG